MNDGLPQSSLLNHPAFAQLTAENQKLLQTAAVPVQFSVGQPLSGGAIVPSRILIIEQGRARLVGRQHGQLCTLALLGEQAVVGLASFLRAEGCEEVSASTLVRAFAIPDATVLHLWQNDPYFRRWCDSTIFPSELAKLIDNILETSERATYGIQDVLSQCVPHAQLLNENQGQWVNELNDRQAFVASANTSKKIGDRLSTDQAPPETFGPLSLRAISLPTEVVDTLKRSNQSEAELQGINNQTKSASPEYNSSKMHGLHPTSINLGTGNLRDRISLTSGKGTLEEIMACFQMLSQALELPYRRDSIEKTIRETLRRGKQPSLPMLGQLAAGMGLHVVGAKVEAINCTRLNVPCLMSWDGGFALAISSNAEGLVLAHPRLGWVELSPNEVQKELPTGFDVILMDRTYSTPENLISTGSGRHLKIQEHTSSSFARFICGAIVHLANPLLIQVIIDKVISQKSRHTPSS